MKMMKETDVFAYMIEKDLILHSKDAEYFLRNYDFRGENIRDMVNEGFLNIDQLPSAVRAALGL